MPCPTKLTDHLSNAESLEQCLAFVQVMELLDAGFQHRIMTTPGIRKLFTSLRAALPGHDVAEPELREPLAKEQPTPAWIKWCLLELRVGPSESRFLQLSGWFDRELDRFGRVIDQLPPQVRTRLGADFDLRSAPQAIPVLAGDDVLRCNRFWIMQPYFGNGKGTIEWSAPRDRVRRLQEILAAFSNEGVTDFAATIELVAATMRKVVIRYTDPWILTYPLSELTKVRLLAGNLQPPVQLTSMGLASALQSELEPLAVSGALIDEAVKQALETGWMRVRALKFRPPGCGTDIKQRYFVPACGVRHELPAAIGSVLVENDLSNAVEMEAGTRRTDANTPVQLAETEDPRAIADALSEKQRTILVTMKELNAVDVGSRYTTATIAKSAMPETAPENFKDPIWKLQRYGLVVTKSGGGGGCWLSLLGAKVANEISLC